MKKLSMWALTIPFCVMLVPGCATMNAGPDPAVDAAAKPGAPAPADPAATASYIEKISFDKTADKEKVIITTSKLMGYTASRESARTLISPSCGGRGWSCSGRNGSSPSLRKAACNRGIGLVNCLEGL